MTTVCQLRGQGCTHQCPIFSLPNEVLVEILNCLVAETPIRDPNRERDLASIVRTCNRFYGLAMPFLWGEMWLWSGYGDKRATTLSYYPSIINSTLSYVRVLRLKMFEVSVYRVPKKQIDRHLIHLSSCLRILKDTNLAIHHLYLRFGLYDLTSKFPEADCHDTIKAINGIAWQILECVNKMELKEFDFELRQKGPPSRVQLEEIFSIIGPKITDLVLPPCDIDSQIKHFERLKAITAGGGIDRRNPQREELFWLTLSQLPRLQSVKVSSMPLPLRTDFHFPRLAHINLFLCSRVRPDEWARSFIFVFTHMPGLETIRLGGHSDYETRSQADIMQIPNIACHNLKQLHLDGPLQKGLLSTIAKNCIFLTGCTLNDDYNIDDEDIRQLSLSCRNLRIVRLSKVQGITGTGIEYFTNLPHLETLELHYPTRLYMQEQLVLKFARRCPKLESITFSDPESVWGRPSERAEPIRIDSLREDMLNVEDVAEQLE